LLVDADAVSGVMDWGDTSLGDRANDLAIGWSALPPAARGEFLAAYGDVSPATWARARLAAVSRHGLALLAWGAGSGDAAIAAWARASLERIAID
jgi:aminoglycoside phosphotransferase (APT) family kinase protein